MWIAEQTAGLRTWLCGAVALVILTGCPDDPVPPSEDSSPKVEASASATGEDTKAAVAPPKAKPAPEPVCEVIETKRLAKHVNARTGLTARVMPKANVMLGVAIGNRPHHLVIDDKGGMRFGRTKLSSASHLDKGIDRKEGVRHLQRVTVVAGDKAFADYRDKYRDGKRRRIACGPTDGAPYVVFDGKPHIAPKKKKKKKKAGIVSRSRALSLVAAKKPGDKVAATATSAAASAKSAAAAPSGKAPTAAGASSSAMAAAPKPAKAVATAGGDDATAAAKTDEKVAAAEAQPSRAPSQAKPEVREIRDCRTMSDPLGKDVWSVGSELVGKLAADGTRDWRMEFFAKLDAGRGVRRLIHSVDMGKDPKRLFTFEAPVAHNLNNGGYLLMARYRGAMMAWTLDANKMAEPRAMRSYRGGYPGLPRLLTDEGQLFAWTSQKAAPKRWTIGMMDLGGAGRLARALTYPDLGDKEQSRAEPTVARAGEQRWLGYHHGDRRRGRLAVMPLDGSFARAGRTHFVTDEKAAVYESHVFGLSDDRLMAVYIVRPAPDAPTELVSTTLKCAVRAL